MALSTDEVALPLEVSDSDACPSVERRLLGPSALGVIVAEGIGAEGVSPPLG